MIRVWWFFKWLFGWPGIQYTTREPIRVKVAGKYLFWFNRHLGIGYMPNGPSSQELMLFSMMERYLHRTFHAYTCKVCGTTVWSYKKVSVCESFVCFCRNGGHWK